MATFVRERAALVVGSLAIIREGRVQDDDAILLGCILVVDREGSESEETLSVSLVESDRPDIQSRRIAITERLLHLSFFWRIRSHLVEPVLTLDPRNVHEVKADSRGVIIAIKHIDLLLDRLVRDISTFLRVVRKDNVEVDGEIRGRVLSRRREAACSEPVFIGHTTFCGDVGTTTSVTRNVAMASWSALDKRRCARQKNKCSEAEF